jgi:hypothetical protein
VNYKLFTFAALAAVLLLQACAPITPRSEKMVANSQNMAMTPALEVLRRNVAYDAGSGTVEKAIEGSLSDASLLQRSGDARFTLKVELRNLGEPNFGLNMTVTASVRYVMTEKSTSRIVFEKTITTPFTAGVGDAVLGSERKKLASEGAFRANIAEFMWELQRLSPTILAAAEPASAPTGTVVTARLPAIEAPEAAKQETQVEARVDVSRNTVASVERMPPAVSPSPATGSSVTAVVPDSRADDMKRTYATLTQQARSGKLRYLQAARLYKEKFLRLYPEESGNIVMAEYLAYMAVLGERIDKKTLTEVEAEYELTRKERELAERVAATRMQSAAEARLATEQAKARTAAEDAAALGAMQAQLAARQEADRLEAARQQAALSAALQAQADEQRRANSAALYVEGLRLLTPPPLLPRQTWCHWSGPFWVCQ